MSEQPSQPSGPDLASGVPFNQLTDGVPLPGHVGDEAVLLVRQGGNIFALGAVCTHYSGPLAEGLVVAETIRCPWHHARFNLTTGEAIGGPALNPVSCWEVVRDGDSVRVAGKRKPKAVRQKPPRQPESIVIVGAGAAGDSAAAELRRLGYEGSVTQVDPDPDASVDRPNLSKDYLAGTAPEDWLPLRPPEFLTKKQITRQRARATALDAQSRRLTLDDGSTLSFGGLILAPGATPVRLELPGDGPTVYVLRTLSDSRAIIAAATAATHAVVLGASFVGLEVAASLRARGLEVHVVAPEKRPLERVLGAEAGDFVRSLHEEQGVVFHPERTAVRRAPQGVELSDGTTLKADLIVAGVGVRPNLELAEKAGLAVEKGILVNQYLETSASMIYAAGDVARYPDPRTGERVRIEHWVVAQRQGRTAARNVLGFAEPFRDAPFFWSQHYDVRIAYAGHAERWDAVDIDGDFAAKDVKVSYRLGGKTLAVASVNRDHPSLEAEAAFEREVVAIA